MRTITANACLVDVVTPSRVWRRIRTASERQSKQTVKVDLSEFTPDRYLLSHCTIIAGVDLENNGYYIKPTHSKWVNDNGNAWDNRVLLNSYKTFIFGENYVEHVQRKDLSRGKILDAVARTVRDEKNKVVTVYVDILVATLREHKQLCSAIETGRVNKMSMGCSVSHTQCSQCGRVFEDDDEDCEHIEGELGQFFVDENGVKRRTAELCGKSDIEGSNEFTESSWVYDPAFTGAIRHGTIQDGDVGEGELLEEVLANHNIVHSSELEGGKQRAASKKLVSLREKVAVRVYKKFEI